MSLFDSLLSLSNIFLSIVKIEQGIGRKSQVNQIVSYGVCFHHFFFSLDKGSLNIARLKRKNGNATNLFLFKSKNKTEVQHAKSYEIKIENIREYVNTVN